MKRKKELLPKQFPVSAPLRMQRGNNFAQEFLEEKGIQSC